MPSKVPVLLTICAVLVLCAIGAGIALILTSGTRSSTAQFSDVPALQSATNGYAYGESEQSPVPAADDTSDSADIQISENVSDTSATQTADTALLKQTQRSLALYFQTNRKYPATLSSLSGTDYFDPTVLNGAYTYETDAPSQDVYSLCTTEGPYYNCVSSSLDEPFVFPKASLDTLDLSNWNGVRIPSSDGGSESTVIYFPPDWQQEFTPATDTAQLIATDDQGADVILMRFNLFDFAPASASETLDEFEQRTTASYPPTMHVEESAARNSPVGRMYVETGTDQEDTQTYAFVIYHLQEPGYFQELAFFGDEGMASRLLPTLSTIIQTLTVSH